MLRQELTTEPRLDDTLKDSIVHALMASDFVTMEELRRVVDAARRRLVEGTEDRAA